MSLLSDPDAFFQTSHERFSIQTKDFSTLFSPAETDGALSAVLLLVGWSRGRRELPTGPFLILTKRSPNVSQAGDLCCPGGSVQRRLDRWLARMLALLPLTPLSRWPDWPRIKRRHPGAASRLSLILAAGLREGFEEMRLSPFAVNLMGPMDPQQLVMYRKTIYPLVCRVAGQKRFRPNWEVQKIVRIPLSAMLNEANYRRCRLQYSPRLRRLAGRRPEDHPCFLHRSRGESEILWGATYRIVTRFLNRTVGFEPPDISRLPVIEKRMDETYMTGVPR